MAETNAPNKSFMRRRRETISGGRYLIYYTFDGESEKNETFAKTPEKMPESTPKLELTEERNV